MEKFSYLGNADINAINHVYESYLQDPNSVDSEWQRFFEGFEFARKQNYIVDTSSEKVDKEFQVIGLIDWYRKRGHLFTETNPVRERRKYFPTLDKENYGLYQADLETVFQAGKQIGVGPAPLSKIISTLKDTYCRSVGAEFMFIRNPIILEWLQKKMESSLNSAVFNTEEKKQIYRHLNLAVGFEKYIHKKFVGQKRFSL
ncbi:MAG: 2-oxoglutarate dehydrogenase E1 component, partial [Bacteroidales bacterium]|nr:2-oxoglutarate dehydrogenase E1 component [Bacteroidales bacterium]